MREDHTTEALGSVRQEAGQQEPAEPYVPRPKWQIITAWILCGIVVLGIINLLWIEMTGV